MDTKEIKFIVSNIPPFNKLKDREIDKFIRLCEVKEYSNRDVIYNESDPPDYFYLLLSGRVVAITNFEGVESEIELLKRGTCFGMISILTAEAHSVTTKSIETSFVLRVEKDKFKKFLNGYPLFFAEFFSLFSQRVKRRTHPKKIFQCRRIAILGPRSSGKTTYMYNLGAQLKEQTKKEVVCLELSFESKFSLEDLIVEGGLNCPVKKTKKVLDLSVVSEDGFNAYVIKDKVDYFLVKTLDSARFGALLNFLSENYHFILYEVPSSSHQNLTDFVYTANFLHLIFSLNKEELKAADVFIKELESINPFNKDKIRLIVSEFDKVEFSREEKIKLVDFPIYATLSSCKVDDYSKAVRRISRQIGEVVVGLALGSGGAYAFSHIGVLKVLRDNNVSIDVVCGSSMGALVAALWAAGFEISEMEKAVKWVSKKLSLFPFTGISLPFKGVLRAKRLENILKSIFGDMSFYDLKRTLKIVAFDFIRRETKILEDGLLYKAVAASCAMPGMFEPVLFKKDILMDGGILNPLPTRILLNYGAHKIIAVNITPSKEEIIRGYKGDRKFHILDFIFGSIETMQREFIERALKISDVVIHPDFGGVGGWMEFDRAEQFIRKGEQAAFEKIEEIRQLVGAGG
ncbi:MAG: patatin-like phospholipase family protein [Candidatus Omnitrophica bacterium]|nr:patatin-like phospholipase family protein [Candidatus Omnitrophota bacterium]